MVGVRERDPAPVARGLVERDVPAGLDPAVAVQDDDHRRGREAHARCSTRSPRPCSPGSGRPSPGAAPRTASRCRRRRPRSGSARPPRSARSCAAPSRASSGVRLHTGSVMLSSGSRRVRPACRRGRAPGRCSRTAARWSADRTSRCTPSVGARRALGVQQTERLTVGRVQLVERRPDRSRSRASSVATRRRSRGLGEALLLPELGRVVRLEPRRRSRCRDGARR